jgi:hypothetical protein
MPMRLTRTRRVGNGSMRGTPAATEDSPLDNPDLWMYCGGRWIIDPLGSFGDNDGD